MHRVDNPVMVTIKKITQETPNVRTFTFDYMLGSQPGQFVMMWIPGMDQKPFSIGNDSGKQFQLTIFELGPATSALFRLRVGDRVGITGPYGTWYTFTPKSHMITVGGGYGAAPLGYLTERGIAEKCTVDFLVGARSKPHLLFERRATRAGADVVVSTDDGSKGYQGYVTDLLVDILEGRKKGKALDNVKVFACGPELMQKKVAEISKKYGVPSEVSIERYIKCGFGICGNCTMDDTGITTCVQGPVVSGDVALRLKEFGKYHRDKVGIRHNY